MTQRDNFLHLFVSEVEAIEKGRNDMPFSCGKLEGMRDLAYAMGLISESEWWKIGSEILNLDDEELEDENVTGITDRVKSILNY